MRAITTMTPMTTMCLRIVAAAALAAIGHTLIAAPPQGRPSSPPPTGTGVLAGRVMRDTTPVARVVVSIDAGDERIDRQTVTDDEGRFQFERLPAGRYLLTASKRGWVTTHFGSPRPGRPPGVRVAVEDGARVNVIVPIVPGGVIAGRIIDAEGRPMARQFPWLLESRIVGDRRMLARARFPADTGFFERSTDDRGEFRLFGLPPGTYYLVVNPSIASGARLTTAAEVRWAAQPPSGAGAAPPPGPLAGYASSYFPGTPDPGAATPIVVGPGEVRDGLTFRVEFVPVSRLSGVATRPDGTPAAGATVEMVAREARVSLEGGGRRASVDAQGRFVFQNVPPGDYRIQARARSGSGPVLDLWAQADAVVTGDDVEGLSLTLAPASVITGRLVFRATALKPPENLAAVRLQFIAVDALAAVQTGAGTISAIHTATMAADGSFRVEGLPPDRYLASATWPGMRTGDGTSGWWLSTIHEGARDLGDAPIEVLANTEVRDVTIGFRDRIGAVEGVLTDSAGRAASEYFVVAFPADRRSWTTTSRRVVPPSRPGTDGRFRIVGLPAGDYYLAVVTAVTVDEASDPAFLELLLPGSIKMTIADGETKRQDLRIGK